ncbi:MAG: hypothetical protein ACRDFX_05150 [Chloroflexota bacterium]
MTSIRMVFRNPWNVLLALVAFTGMAIFYLWSSQVLTFTGRGIELVVQPEFTAAALVMAVLFAALIPLMVYSFRLAVASASQTGGTVLGAVVGTASMTCCAPVLLPSVLSLFGVSGTSLLGINGVLSKYWLPLATLSIIFLLYSLYSVISGLNLECELSNRVLSGGELQTHELSGSEERVSVL